MMLPFPFHLEQRGRIDSSNDEARRLAAAGFGHGTVVSATEQTAGRGRRGRPWNSPPGNLYCSLLLDPGPDAAAAPQLAFVAAVALQAALADMNNNAIFRVKWPNDVLCNGGKIAGMLLEQVAGLIILGVGVNISFHPEDALYPATCLRKTGSGAEIDDVLSGFCTHLAERYQEWRQHGFAPIRAAWLAVASGQGEKITARLADGSTLIGKFAGMAEDGALELAIDAGIVRRIVAGDVFFGSEA
jgi:BirA family biotin operon repressor/biotin-[acetyl-CoA-carboxylase] ligase